METMQHSTVSQKSRALDLVQAYVKTRKKNNITTYRWSRLPSPALRLDLVV